MLTDYNIMAGYNLGAEFFKVGLYQEAEIALKICVDMNEKGDIAKMYRAACANILGVIYLEGKLYGADPFKANEYLRIAYKLEPDNGSYVVNLALSHHAMGDEQIAIELYKECLGAELTDQFTANIKALCYSSLGTLLVEGELYGSALFFNKMSHELAPSDIKFIMPLAMNYYHLEDFVMVLNLLKNCTNMEANTKTEMEYQDYCHQFLGLIDDKLIEEAA